MFDINNIHFTTIDTIRYSRVDYILIIKIIQFPRQSY